MMCNAVRILAVIALLGFVNESYAENVLFEIGKKDNSAAEFALSPDKYKNFLIDFSGVKHFAVGYSKPLKSWPYVLPGPKDGWGGGGYWSGYHPRHFPIINFMISQVKTDGTSRLELFFVGADEKESPVMRIEINGHRIEKRLEGKSTDKLLNGEESASPLQCVVDFPTEWMKTGMNQIQLGLIEGRWCMFDCIRLSGPDGIVVDPISSSLITSVKAADFEYEETGKGRFLPILVEMVQYDRPRTLTFTCGKVKEKRLVETGKSIQQILVPAIKGNTREETFTIYAGKQLLYKGTVTLAPQPLHTYSDDVDILMGTGNSRWMYKPSVSLPFGMVQIAPDNEDETWKAGYEYTIENISGFNHFCDWTIDGFLMQPTCGKLQVNPGPENDPDAGYRSRIDKSTETAEVGRYSVYMTDTRIKAEVSATDRASIQAYTFPANCKDGRVLVDLYAPSEYPHNLQDAHVTRVSDTEIEGYATYFGAYTGYTAEQYYTIHFVMQFDKPFVSMGGWVNDRIKAYEGYVWSWDSNHEFDTEPKIMNDINEVHGKGDVGFFLNFAEASSAFTVKVRTGVSLVDIAGARNNLQKELSEPFGWDLDKVVANARSVWNDYLHRIEIETEDYLQQKKFYSNLYRAIAAKASWSDFDGRFRDEREQICQLESSRDRIISGEYWNTFWDNQQLFNLIAPELSSQWARSAIHLYKNCGWFNTDPAGIEHTGVMVAMHMVSQIWGAWQSGIRDFDLETAYVGLKKMLLTPPQHYEGGGTVGVEHLVPYMKYGYIPQGMGLSSNTMEYAYDDWCLAQMAKYLGYEEDYTYFLKRSENWMNLFDTESGFIRPKDKDGNWISPFDPYHTPGFTEGNSFNYTWFVPHTPEKLVELMGRERFVSRLDSAMTKSSLANFNASGDDFANYPINHGNETSMEVAYLFNWGGAPHLTQKWVRAIQEQYYGTTPYDAYPGDEDLGQMSSWFVMSVIGFFQMDGGCSQQPFYELGSPRYPKITLHLGNRYGRGKTFVIEAKNASKENKYIRSIRLNGKKINGFKIPQADVLKGGRLELEMTDSVD